MRRQATSDALKGQEKAGTENNLARRAMGIGVK
jgi:hypothetical protein